MKKIALLALLALLPSCAWLESKGSAAEKAFVDCAKADVASKAGEILAQVTQIILAGGTGYQAELSSVGKTAGSDALVCAVKTVGIVFAAEAPKAADSPFAAAATRAQSYVKDVRFK